MTGRDRMRISMRGGSVRTSGRAWRPRSRRFSAGGRGWMTPQVRCMRGRKRKRSCRRWWVRSPIRPPCTRATGCVDKISPVRVRIYPPVLPNAPPFLVRAIILCFLDARTTRTCAPAPPKPSAPLKIRRQPAFTCLIDQRTPPPRKWTHYVRACMDPNVGTRVRTRASCGCVVPRFVANRPGC